ncbi:putative TIM-barrel fold metal-dependent hydrolase [Variovorax boronicumulans]|uniref:amidohydrolase family protein n=1 Tax=Variovorax boronicumulans TaxID=436515 RepID=UPI002781CD19|nr:amidohydrolase family protein [Variovorax boronicumulans]MDQ0083221.1 putative TIM-barrel fold metal-dependent hydrolase [Variovorax boronicumulans]
MSSQILTSTPMRAPETLACPAFTVPAGACDSHVHVFESEDRYPHVDQPHYTLPDGPLTKLDAMCESLDLARYVIVQPSFYGTDNRCMLDALEIAGERARGVAMVADSVTEETLHDMHRRGVRALRLDLFLRSGLPTAELVQYIQRSVRMTKALGWHLQFYTPGWVVRDLIPYLGDIDADFVIDHMGYMLESDGLTRQDFDRLLRVLADGRGWMKLSGPYRVAKDGNFEKLRPLAHAIVDALPERTIWGSDWPHIPDGARDTGELLNLLAPWAPDAPARQRILVDNPARLFGFAPIPQ